ncbi:S8 family serine peptidase [Streptomyces corynorhini]|uniref:Serine protease n=1 Tax=Streptomyces corynorhini TaxID=2282652 RepID=A0A370BE55_9ACTN|nr:S8 family serine peptidase [Streptomyces corynorhini]RDG37715.1 serine protease [Streptomyces corynorhini]
MAAETERAVKRRRRRGVRRGIISTLAVVGAWSVVITGMAPPAVAVDDVQSKQWYLDAMRAEDMWKVTTGEGIKVAVIDTGVNPNTPSLKGQILKGLDATRIGKETDDYAGHGTTMAELIAGTGKGGGLQGLAPGVKIIPMRISDTEFQNENPVKGGDAEDAIRAAADSDAQIISMSFGSDYSSPEEREAAKYAESKGKLFFAAAGNNADNGNKRQFPASYPNVIGVASADNKGNVSDYSQHGGSVDIASPGSDIPAWCDNKFQSYCGGDGGTSSATAIASASAALLWSAHRDWTANQVLRVLFDTASRTWKESERSSYLGNGLIRPGVNILHGKGDPGDPDINPLTNEKTPGIPGSATPSPASSASSKAPAPDDKSADGDKAVAAGAADDAGGNKTVLFVGTVAVVAVLAGGAFAVVRRRRSA